LNDPLAEGTSEIVGRLAHLEMNGGYIDPTTGKLHAFSDDPELQRFFHQVEGRMLLLQNPEAIF